MEFELDSSKCDAANASFALSLDNLKKWQKQKRALGIATVVSSIVLLAAAALLIFGIPGLGTNIGLAVGSAATVITGAGFIFVTNSAKTAQQEHDRALRAVAKHCGADRALSLI